MPYRTAIYLIAGCLFLAVKTTGTVSKELSLIFIILPVLGTVLELYRRSVKKEVISPGRWGALVFAFIWIRETGIPKSFVDPALFAGVTVAISYALAPGISKKFLNWQPSQRPFLIGSAFFLMVFTLIPALRYHSFHAEWLDLGYILHPLWNTLHGRPLEMALWDGTFGNRLGDHATPILFLLALPYALFPHPVTLYAINALTVLMGFFFLNRIMRFYEFKGNTRFLLLLALGLNFPLQYGLIWDFHCDVMTGGFIAGMFYFSITHRPSTAFLFFILALSTKEHISLALIPVLAGLWLNDKKQGKMYATMALFSLLYFVFAVQWMTPYFNEGKQSASWVLSIKTESEDASILTSLADKIINPISLIAQTATLKNWENLLLFFSVLLFLPFYHWRFILFPSLFLLKECLLGHSALSNHHWTVVSVICFFTIILYLLDKQRKSRLKIASALLVAGVISGAVHGESLLSQRFWRVLPQRYLLDSRDKNLQKAINLIPKQAAAIAQSHTAVHLANRQWLFLYPNKIDSNFNRYILLDTAFYDQAVPRYKNLAYHKGNEKYYFIKTLEIQSQPNCSTSFQQGSVFLIECHERKI